MASVALFALCCPENTARAQSVPVTVNVGGETPGPIAVNSATNKVYVASVASAGIGSFATVVVIDGVTNSTATVSLSETIQDIAVNSVTGKVYVAGCGDLFCDGYVAVIDGVTNDANWLSAGSRPSAVVVDSVTNKIYVKNYDSVTVIDGASDSTQTVSVGNGYGPGATSWDSNRPLAVDSATNKIYVANYNDQTITVIDGVSDDTTTISGVPYPQSIAVNPATNKIYVTGGGGITEIDGNTNNVTRFEGEYSGVIAANPASNQVYVANFDGDTITVIEGANNNLNTVSVGGGTSAIAVNPVSNVFYVVNGSSNSVTAIDPSTNGTSTINTGFRPIAAAIDSVTNRIYVVNECGSDPNCSSGGTVSVIDGASGGALSTGWAHAWGGINSDSISSTSRDANGDVYLAGSTSSFGAGGQDALILKYDPTGNLLWAKTWGGSSDDYGNGVAVDSNGNVYVTGGTSSFGAGWYDLFLLKFDPSGNLLWSETWGGSSYDEGHDISFDSSGNVLVAAETYSYNPPGTGYSSAVILKFSPDGTLLWNRAWEAQIPIIRGPTYDGGYSLAVDGSGNIFLSGITWDYNISPNHDSIFVVKFDSSGNFLWNRNWAGTSEDEAWGTKTVRADAAGNVYIAGRTASECNSANFGTCDFDVSILKLDSGGDFVWSRTWRAGAGYDTAISFDFDPRGNLVVTGAKDEFGATAAPMLLRFDPNGNLLSSLAWSGGPGAVGSAVTVDPSGDIFIGGNAPNNAGSWQPFSGSVGTENGTLTNQPSAVATPTFEPVSQSGTITSPAGVIGTGGGGQDAFVSAIPANYTPPASGQPAASISPSPLNFPSQTVNTPSTALAVTVANIGTAGLNITNAPAISGASASDFAIASGTTCMSGASVAPGSSCAVEITFTPSTATSESATLYVYDNAAHSPQAAALNGTGVAPAGPPPTITSFSPPQGFLGGQISPFIITGTDFQPGAIVLFGGDGIVVDPSSVVVAPTQIDGTLSVSSSAYAGSFGVTVTNPDGQSSTFTTALNILTIPPPPKGLSAVVGNGIVHLQWAGGQSVPQGYNVYVNGAKANSSGLLDHPGFGVTGLQNGQLYKLDVTAVGSSESNPATIFAEPNGFLAPPHPLHPVLFLHGIAADATAWEATADFLTGTLGWTCGGTLAYAPTDDPKTVSPHPASPSPTPCDHTFSSSGDYFTVDFGDKLANYPDGRAIFHQGDEVGGFIQTIGNGKKLSVVGWSMGGLAARAYIQATNPSLAPGQISDLITMGTPHWGVHRSYLLEPGNAEGLSLLGKVFGFDLADILSSQGLVAMDGGCVSNGDSSDYPNQLSPFLYDLDVSSAYASLPGSIRYAVVSGIIPASVLEHDECSADVIPPSVPSDGVVPATSSTFARIVSSSQKWFATSRDDNHLYLPSDISAILCALDPNCVELQVMSPVDIQVTVPSGLAISPTFTSIPGADYTTLTDANGHETATILIPFPQGGQYTIAVTPKPGAQPTDTFTILQTQGGATTTIAESMQIASIPPSGFQTIVKNGSTYTMNFGGSVQQPVTNDGNGHFVATVVVTNQGNVTVDSAQIVATTTTLSTASLTSAPTPITNLAPGTSAAVALTFPISSALSTATSAPLKINGTYSAGTLSGNWSVTFRSVTLAH